MAYGSSQPGGWIKSCSPCWPTPQPQQCSIWAVSVTYTTNHSNARSLTHWPREGIKPTSSWILVRFISAIPQWELLFVDFLMVVILTRVKWYIIVVLNCIYITITNINHISMCFLAIHLSSLEKCLFRISTHSLILFLFLILSCMCPLYILEINLSWSLCLQIFSLILWTDVFFSLWFPLLFKRF